MKLFLDLENLFEYPKRLSYKEQMTFKVCNTDKTIFEHSYDYCISNEIGSVCKMSKPNSSRVNNLRQEEIRFNEFENLHFEAHDQGIKQKFTSLKRKNGACLRKIIRKNWPNQTSSSNANNNNNLFFTKKMPFNSGRWKEDEHKRFIEAILLYGNEWKNIQKHIHSRSSTQSRSHSQKFFLKIKSSQSMILNVKDPCLASLCQAAKKLSDKERESLIEHLISLEYDCSNSSINQDYCNSSSVKNKPVRSFTVTNNYSKLSTKCTGNPIVESSSESSGNDLNLEIVNDCDPLSPGGLTTCSTVFSSINTISIQHNLKQEAYSDSESNDFNNEFLNAFLHSNCRLRRVSFEETLAHNMYMFKAIKSDISPALDSQASSLQLNQEWDNNTLENMNYSANEDDYLSAN